MLNTIKRLLLVGLLIAFIAPLIGCGQPGDLYLPDAPEKDQNR